MKKLFFIIGILFFSAANAQKAKLAVGCKSDKSGKLIVQLKFLFPDKVISDYSVNVYRKPQGGSWEKINTAPVVKASLTENSADEDYKTYKAYMTRKPMADADDENNAQAMAGLMIVSNNGFAKYTGCYYEDEAAVKGSIYQYRIADGKNGDKELAVSEMITVNEKYLPVVTGISGAQVKQNVHLDWKPDNKFFAYNVYRKTSPDKTGVLLSLQSIMLVTPDVEDKSGKETKFVDTALAQGTFYYEVTGIDVLGNESEPSAAFKTEVKDMTPPATVKNLKGKRQGSEALLNWDAVSSKDLKGYNVYRNNSADTSYKKITSSPLTTTTYTDKETKEGAVYGYKIEAVDNAGNGSMSRPVKVFFADQTPPAKPTGLKAVSKPGTIQIIWDKNKENDLKGYYIFRASNKNKEYFNMLYQHPITTNSFNDTLPGVARNEFVYYIQAVDKSYNVSVPSDTVVVMLPDTTAPHKPVIARAEYVNGAVALDVTLDNDAETMYDVYRCDDSLNSKNYKRITRTPVANKTYTDMISDKDKSYHYYVVSVDKAGNASEPSQKRTVFVDAEKAVLSPAGNLRAVFNSADTAITISWNAGATNGNGYIVYRKAGDETYKPVSGVLKVTAYTDRPVESGTTYKYLVRSFFTDEPGYVNSKEVEIVAK